MVEVAAQEKEEDIGCFVSDGSPMRCSISYCDGRGGHNFEAVSDRFILPSPVALHCTRAALPTIAPARRQPTPAPA